MTLELTAGKSRYQYRIHERDKRIIERRMNKHGARWGFYKVCDSPNDAKRALLAMQDGEGKEVPEK